MSLAASLALVLAVDCTLLCGPALSRLLAPEHALLVCFGAALTLVLWARQRLPGPRLAAGCRATLLVLGLVTGFASLPAWLALTWNLGCSLGLEAGPPPPPVKAGPAFWLASTLMAPVFEEVLYRERLLATLRARVGAIPALILSAAAFALPHPGPWPWLGTFLVGTGLGAVALVGRSLCLCIGLHAGLNLAILMPGAP